VRTIDITELHRLFRFDPETGVLYRKMARGGTPEGGVAGHVNRSGYVKVQVGKFTYGAHRIGWAMHYGEWPEHRLDHINCNTSDNRIANLRQATVAENARNILRPRDNTSGYKGVCLHRQTGKFAAQIRVNMKRIHLGLFKSPEEAHRAYVDAAIKYHGDFHNPGYHSAAINRARTGEGG
jgi:HNH endonuclease/AP2 domain